ncbi:MAG: (Na+)-NQR maturation NqrM [Myxococcota bacterium]
MTTFLAALVVVGLTVLAMSLGAMVQGRRLRGSCGGTGQDCSCSPVAARNCELRKQRDAGAAGS